MPDYWCMWMLLLLPLQRVSEECGSCLGLDTVLNIRAHSVHHLAAPVPVAEPHRVCPLWLGSPHPWEGWEAHLQPGSVQEVGDSPHLGLHHADPLLPQLLHTVKDVHLPLGLCHLQEEIHGDEGTRPPDPGTEDTEKERLVLPWPALLQHPSIPILVPAVHQHRASRGL